MPPSPRKGRFYKKPSPISNDAYLNEIIDRHDKWYRRDVQQRLAVSLRREYPGMELRKLAEIMGISELEFAAHLHRHAETLKRKKEGKE